MPAGLVKAYLAGYNNQEFLGPLNHTIRFISKIHNKAVN